MNFKDVIKSSIIDNFSGDISTERICIALGVTALLGIYIFLVYRVAVNNEFYSKDFNRTLVLMSITTAGIVLAIQSNLVISLGMVGALSIIRYRTAVKSSLDLFFLFWAISVGIICGAGLYVLAALMSIVITIVLWIVGKIASPVKLGLLVINCKNLECAEMAIGMIKEHSIFSCVKSKTVSREMVEVIVEFKAKKNHDLEKNLLESEGIKKYSFISYDRENRI